MKHTALLSIMLLLLIGNLHSTIIGVPTDQPTIQAGIDTSADGDTVLVSQGIYLENVNFKGKGILLTSNFIFTRDSLDIFNTIIEGGAHSHPDTGSCVYFVSGEDYTSQLIGFTLQNGTGIENDEGFDIGGGVFCSESNPLITSNLFRSNDTGLSVGLGGGIAIVNSDNPIIMDNIVDDNYAGLGGGLFSVHSGGFIFRNCFKMNGSFAHGGGILTVQSNLIIEQNIFRDNVTSDGVQRGWGGAIYIFNCHGTVIRNNTFAYNFALVLGGAIYIDGDISIVENNILFQNSYIGIVGPIQGVTLLYNNLWDNYPENYYQIPPGEFDISENPLFVDELNDDFHLQSDSPCIDAGNPDSPNVPWGGFRRDIGAFEYDHGFYFDGQNTIYKPDIPVRIGDITL